MKEVEDFLLAEEVCGGCVCFVLVRECCLLFVYFYVVSSCVVKAFRDEL